MTNQTTILDGRLTVNVMTPDEYEAWCAANDVAPYENLIDYSGTTLESDTGQGEIKHRAIGGAREEFVGAIPTEFYGRGQHNPGVPDEQLLGGSSYWRLWDVLPHLGLTHEDYALSGAEEDGSGGVALLRRPIQT